MSASKSPVGHKLDEILASSEWMNLDEVVHAVGKVVPAGQAIRAANAKGSTPKREYAPGVGTAVAVARGRRYKAMDVICSRVRVGTIERDGGRIRRISQ